MRTAFFAVSTALCLTACVGPNFTPPTPPTGATSYTEAPQPEVSDSANINGGATQRFVTGQDIPAEWWKLFNSDAINHMVQNAIRRNASLGSAQAVLRQAHYLVLAQRGTFLPSIDAQGTFTRAKQAGPFGGAPTVSQQWGAALGAAYTLDIFGANYRQFESVGAQEDFERFQMEGTYLNLITNVMLAAIDEASLRAQIAVTNDIIKSQTQELDLLNQQFQLGAVAKGDVLAQQAQLATTQATLPPLQKQLAQVRNAMAILFGNLPNNPGIEEVTLDTLTLPQQIPLSIPAKLIDQRPDVRASEALLHQASAQVGVATAALFPTIQLTGNYSSSAAVVGDLFITSGTGANVGWSLFGSLTQPIFHGGELWYRRRASQAAYDSAAEQYRNTVLSGFSDVANSLKILDLDAQALKIQLEAERSARESFEITRERFRAGAISYISLLDAERIYQQARILLVQAQANRFADTVQLFQALGGGWWNRDDTPPMTEDEARAAMAARDAEPPPRATPVVAPTAGEATRPTAPPSTGPHTANPPPAAASPGMGPVPTLSPQPPTTPTLQNASPRASSAPSVAAPRDWSGSAQGNAAPPATSGAPRNITPNTPSSSDTSSSSTSTTPAPSGWPH